MFAPESRFRILAVQRRLLEGPKQSDLGTRRDGLNLDVELPPGIVGQQVAGGVPVRRDAKSCRMRVVATTDALREVSAQEDVLSKYPIVALVVFLPSIDNSPRSDRARSNSVLMSSAEVFHRLAIRRIVPI